MPPPSEWPNPVIGVEVVGDRQQVEHHAVPVEVVVVRPCGEAVTAEVEGHDTEVIAQPGRHRLVHRAQETGGVGDEQGWTVTTELMGRGVWTPSTLGTVHDGSRRRCTRP